MYYSDYITAEQVEQYIQRDPNCHSHCEADTIYLVCIDALTNNKTWPIYAVLNGEFYERGSQCAMPYELPLHSYFGCREYRKAKDDSERSLKYAIILPTKE